MFIVRNPPPPKTPILIPKAPENYGVRLQGCRLRAEGLGGFLDPVMRKVPLRFVSSSHPVVHAPNMHQRHVLDTLDELLGLAARGGVQCPCEVPLSPLSLSLSLSLSHTHTTCINHPVAAVVGTSNVLHQKPVWTFWTHCMVLRS